MAAGNTMRKFSLNLSFISQPCVFTAAMVVSDIMDRLSPNMAPPTTAPAQTAMENPVFWLIPTAMGARAVIVPTEVPMDMDIKHPMRNNPATATLEGRMDSPRLTVESTPPAAFTAPVKAPAARNMRHMVMMFSSPTPCAASLIFSAKPSSLFCTKAARSAIKKATMAGIL